MYMTGLTTLQISNLLRDEEYVRDISSGDDSDLDKSYKPGPDKALDGCTSDEDTQVCTGCPIIIA